VDNGCFAIIFVKFEDFFCLIAAENQIIFILFLDKKYVKYLNISFAVNFMEKYYQIRTYFGCECLKKLTSYQKDRKIFTFPNHPHSPISLPADIGDVQSQTVSLARFIH
jgi:hypothetical protein